METGSAHCTVTVDRIAAGRFTVANARGGRITLAADGADFTPAELLLAAIGGCTAIDVDALASRRAEPERFQVLVDASKVRDSAGNHLTKEVCSRRATGDVNRASPALPA